MTQIKKQFKAKGMHCPSCEKIIIMTVKGIEGVKNIKVDYRTEKGEVTFDENKTSFEKICKTIEEQGYTCSSLESNEDDEYNDEYIIINKEMFGWVFGILGIIIVGYFLLKLTDIIQLPQISQNMGYGLLFLVGLLTGFHCIAMCGGFVVSYTAKDAQEGRKSYKSHLMYGVGKTLSYTIIGAIFGLVGSIITFTPFIRGFAGIIAGLFLIIFGINMLGFKFLRNLRIKTPSFIEKFVSKEFRHNNSPLIIGLLNGLMIACGPLQAIYIMAAGTGSMIEGAKILFIFGLGTLPVMLGFGFLTSVISSKLTHKILKISGIVVILLGLIMMNRGLALTGSGLDTTSLLGSASTNDGLIKNNAISIEGGYQIINMDVSSGGYSPNSFVLEKGVPAKWNVNVKELTSCNSELVLNAYNIDKRLSQGINLIEFTPDKVGTITFTCGMGMLRGNFIVTEDGTATQDQITGAAVKNTGTSCGMGGGCGGGCGGSGGCGCGTK